MLIDRDIRFECLKLAHQHVAEPTDVKIVMEHAQLYLAFVLSENGAKAQADKSDEG